jgi:hypothetical protein
MLLGSYLDGTGYECRNFKDVTFCDNCSSDTTDEIPNTTVATTEAMEDFYIMPAVGSLPVADSGNEEQRQKNLGDFALRFQSAMNDAEGTCTVCKASGSSDCRHIFSAGCSYIERRRCIGCLSSEHPWANQCRNKLKFMPNVGICYRCGLTNRIQQVRLQTNQMLLQDFAVLYLTKYNR